MEDPSDGVPHNLLQHIHLVSTYKWATSSRVRIETIMEHLLLAPKIVAEVSAMQWMYLDAPPDNTVLLVWQPQARLGHRFASDGYIWADVESSFKQEFRGYAEREDHHPVNRIPLNREQQTILAQRNYLQQQGQLVRKEFMLKDRNNWPRINAPQAPIPHYVQQTPVYPGNVMQEMHLNRAPQQVHMSNSHPSAGYQGMGPSPAKRQRPAPSNQRPGSSNAYAASLTGLDPEIEGEDDYGLGDYLDLITPRDISAARYKQHHEWMAEILESPYATGQIMPVELGLGRKGELESLTRGFFEAPIGPAPIGPTPRSDKATPPAIGFENGKVEEFVMRATAKVAEISAELEKMKRLHAKRMSRLGKGSIVKDAEKHLRSVVVPAETRLQPVAITEFDKTAATLRQQERIDEIAAEVENAIKKKIEAVYGLNCVQKGGLEEKSALDPKHTNDALPSAPTAVQDDALTEPLDISLAVFPEFDDKADWLQGDHDAPSETADMLETSVQPEDNIEMSEPPSSLEPQAHGADSGDWVMVDRQGDGDGNAATMVESSQLENRNENTTEETDIDKLGAVLPDFNDDVQGISTEGFDGAEFDDTVDFGNLDTAGDALAGYEDHEGGVDNDEQMGLVLEDSAFGDAFHDTEPIAEDDSQSKRPAPCHPLHSSRRPRSPYESSGEAVGEGNKWSEMHLWDTANDFAMEAPDGHPLRNEQFNYTVPHRPSGRSFQGGVDDNDRIYCEGDFEAYVNRSREVQDHENMLRNAEFIKNGVLPLDHAGMPVRDVGDEQPLEEEEEGFLSPETDQSAEHNSSWCTVLHGADGYCSATISPPLNDYFSTEFLQDLPDGLNTYHLPNSIDDNTFNMSLPTSRQDIISDWSSDHHDPSFFYSTASRPCSGDHQPGNLLKQQWRILNIAAASLRRQRHRIRHSLRVFYRSQKALDIEWREFRNLRDNNIRDSRRGRGWYSNGRRSATDDSEDAWSRDTRHFWGSGRRTEQPGKENLFYAASKSDDEPCGPSDRNYYHNLEHPNFTGRHRQTTPPPLVADAIDQAGKHLANYESAWSSLSKRSQATSSSIPYPTVTLQSAPLLEPFPSYVGLPCQPAFHPSPHVRIQFHALEFYLHPLGLQASLTFSSPMQSFGDPEQVPDAVLDADGIERLDSGALTRLRDMMIKEVRKWHEDRLREKGFSTVLDCERAIRQECDTRSKESKDGQYTHDSKHVMERADSSDEKLTERDIVQGVWAAVQLLKEIVKAELEKRKMR
ncbi:hypothetical protein MMC18_008301 [Xylographa bjoerkii]|nr:hypothetical protein [Xylographa bjoerkii]